MDWMAQALQLAEQGRTTCMPNPMVGCVIVKDNQIIGSGAHLKAGSPHAEIIALEQAGEWAKGADVYLTLEPCSHFGRTPPCVDSMIRAGVKTVHIALPDPNPLVNGQSIQKLHQAGIGITLGQCQEQAYQLNKIFFHYITQQQPFVIAKWAMSLDGKIVAPQGNKSVQEENRESNRWITSEHARAHAHRIRAQVSAIMVGANTVRQDNPWLTARHGFSDSPHTQPRPIVVTLSGEIPQDSNIFAPNRNAIVLTSNQTPQAFLHMLDKRCIEHYQFPLINKHLDLPTVLNKLASLQLSSLLVEGGSHLLTTFFSSDLVNQVYVYISPKIIGKEANLSPMLESDLSVEEFILHPQQTLTLGPDLCLIAEMPKTPRTYSNFLTQKGGKNVCWHR